MSAEDLLRYARRAAGLSQRKLAERTGVAQPSIARIETGRSSPRSRTLERLLDACGFRLELARRAGDGIDRSAIRELLKLSPEERLRLTAREAETLDLVLSETRPR